MDNWTSEEKELRRQVDRGMAVVCDLHVVKGLHVNLVNWAKANNKFTYIGRRIRFHKEYKTNSKWCNESLKEIAKRLNLEAVNNTIAVDYFINEIYNKRPDLQAVIHELKGQVLGCWCKPDVCHGDYLAEQANKIEGD
jgi:hypothetical protein